MDIQKKNFIILKELYWDYDFDPEEIYSVLSDKKEIYYHLTKEKIFIRMLEHLGWYDILNIMGPDNIKRTLTAEIISKLRFKILQRRYERLRKILHGEAVPADGWDPEFIKSVRASLLSDRWYGSFQRIF